jgi:predicted transport protein
MVTTQAFPISMRRVNKKLRLIENPRIISELIKSSQNTNEQVAIISNKVENVVKIIKKDTKVKVSEKDTLNFIIGLVNKAQPWLVLILFISHFLSKRK